MDPRARVRDPLNDFGARGNQVLAIVQNDQELPRAERLDQRVQRRLVAVDRGPHGGCNGRRHQRTVNECRQLHQPRAVSEIGDRRARRRQCQAGFANSTYPNQRHDALLADQLGNAVHILIASDERG
jgi:hypothetical protein